MAHGNSFEKFGDAEMCTRFWKACRRLNKWRAVTSKNQGYVAKRAKVNRSYISKAETIGAANSVEEAFEIDNYAEVWPNRKKRDSAGYRLMTWIEQNCGYDFVDESQLRDLEGLEGAERWRVRFGWRVKQFHDAFLMSAAAFDHLDDLHYEATNMKLPREHLSATFANWSLSAMNTVDKVDLVAEATAFQMERAEKSVLSMVKLVAKLRPGNCAKTTYAKTKAEGYVGISMAWFDVHEKCDSRAVQYRRLIGSALLAPHPKRDGHWCNALRLGETLLGTGNPGAEEFAKCLGEIASNPTANRANLAADWKDLHLPMLTRIWKNCFPDVLKLLQKSVHVAVALLILAALMASLAINGIHTPSRAANALAVRGSITAVAPIPSHIGEKGSITRSPQEAKTDFLLAGTGSITSSVADPNERRFA